MSALVGMGWHPMWSTFVGCLKGCLDYVGFEDSAAWIYGGTGHAFVLNVHPELCPSGPTAWNTRTMHRLAANVGADLRGIVGFRKDPRIAALREQAWEAVKGAIDEGFPVIGWELDVPEYYIIYGYEDDGYLYLGPGCDDGAGPKPWRELGATGIGVLEVFVVRPSIPATDETTVRDAIREALTWSRPDCPRRFEGYATGPEAYRTLIRALREGRADGFGAAYNLQVWAECRRMAARFLQEASCRLPDDRADLLKQAGEHYAACAEFWESAASVLPFFGTTEQDKRSVIADPEACARMADSLEAARVAEAEGIAELAAIPGIPEPDASA